MANICFACTGAGKGREQDAASFAKFATCPASARVSRLA